MQLKKCFCLLMGSIISLSCFCVDAGAINASPREAETVISRASGRFSMDIPGGELLKANSDFPLEAGETVTIKASYSPFSASVDFGLIAPDGYFYYINVTDGSFDETIEVDERGNYTLAIRNNSSKTISVSGYVNY